MSEYLYNPAEVDRVLVARPFLHKALPLSPAAEGESSVHLPGVRKSRRQLYRILGNVHYEHLADLVRTLNMCAEHGYRQPTLWRTRGQGNFGSALAELATAEHLLLHGFEVLGLDENKGQLPVPDLLARRECVPTFRR